MTAANIHGDSETIKFCGDGLSVIKTSGLFASRLDRFACPDRVQFATDPPDTGWG